MYRDRHHVYSPGRVAWSAVVDRSGPDDGELAWLRLEEIRLYASIILSERRPDLNGRVILVPATFPEWVEYDLRRFGSAESVGDLSVAAEQFARHACASLIDPPRTQRCEVASVGSDDETERLMWAIDASNELLMRGLSKFVTANHLVWYRPFLEEGGLAAFVALEAGLELLRRQISVRNGTIFSFERLLSELEAEPEDGEAFVAYLRELYDARILLVHPASRLGTFWTPPIDADDCYFCINVCTYIYRRLLLGETAA